MSELAQHSSKSVEHYTPSYIVEPSRGTLGEIDLDPATCDLGQEIVRAANWYGTDPCSDIPPGQWLGHDGFFKSWNGRVFLNPPGGQLDPETLRPAKRGISSAGAWWGKLMIEWESGAVHSAIFVCFSMAVFRAAQSAAPELPPPYAFPFCVPRSRINYDRCGDDGRREATSGAPADSAIVFVPPKNHEEHGHAVRRFRENFGPLGYVHTSI